MLNLEPSRVKTKYGLSYYLYRPSLKLEWNIMIDNIAKKIEDAIEDYVQNIDLNFLSEEDADSVKMAIDSEKIVSTVLSEIKSHVFRFDPSDYGNYSCHSCQKMFGDFVSENGARVEADKLLRPGVTIILD
jgi:hypothetical protein